MIYQSLKKKKSAENTSYKSVVHSIWGEKIESNNLNADKYEYAYIHIGSARSIT